VARRSNELLEPIDVELIETKFIETKFLETPFKCPSSDAQISNEIRRPDWLKAVLLTIYSDLEEDLKCHPQY
jgi:hypothetical protein